MSLRRIAVSGLRFPGRYHPRWLLGQLGFAGGLSMLGSLVIYFNLLAGGLHAPLWQLWLACTGLLLVVWLLYPLRGSSPRPPLAPDTSSSDLIREPFQQAARWERRLTTTHDDPGWYEWVVRDRITVVAAARLRQRHGVRLRAEPDRARQLLGDELYEFLTEPVTRPPTPAGLARLTTRIEEI